MPDDDVEFAKSRSSSRCVLLGFAKAGMTGRGVHSMHSVRCTEGIFFDTEQLVLADCIRRRSLHRHVIMSTIADRFTPTNMCFQSSSGK